MKCPHCEHEINVAMSTCPHCGAEVMKICPACKNYVRAELDHCPSCGAPLISLAEAVRTVRPEPPTPAEPAALAHQRTTAAPTSRATIRAGLGTLPRPNRGKLIALIVALIIYGGLIGGAALFLRSGESIPLLILGAIIGGALGAALGLGKALTGLPPHHDDILGDIWPSLAAGAFTGLFLTFFGLQEDLLAPEVLLVAAAGAVFGVLFSLAFSWGSGPEGAQGLRGIVGHPVVGLLSGICLGIGAMVVLGNLVLQLRRPGM